MPVSRAFSCAREDVVRRMQEGKERRLIFGHQVPTRATAKSSKYKCWAKRYTAAKRVVLHAHMVLCVVYKK